MSTILFRPYVFAFLAMYLLAATYREGYLRTLAFTAVVWPLAYISEFLSVRIGIPYGLYHYLPESTAGKELWVFGIPFMDSLSYTFMNYCAFMAALHLMSPRKKGLLLDSPSLRRSVVIALLSAFFVTFLDIIIDPIAHQGEKWFLDKIYYYPNPGAYFEIPLSNFAGWFVVGFTSIFIYQRLDKYLDRFERRAPGQRTFTLPYGDFLGLILYLSILIFNLVVTIYVGDMKLAIVDSFLITVGLVLYAIAWSRPPSVSHESS